MPIVMVPVQQVRPKEATPEYILALRNAGVRVVDIATLCHVTPARIYAILAHHRKKQAQQPPVAA